MMMIMKTNRYVRVLCSLTPSLLSLSLSLSLSPSKYIVITKGFTIVYEF